MAKIRRKFMNSAEIGGYAICIIDLGEMDAPVLDR